MSPASVRPLPPSLTWSFWQAQFDEAEGDFDRTMDLYREMMKPPYSLETMLELRRQLAILDGAEDKANDPSYGGIITTSVERLDRQATEWILGQDVLSWRAYELHLCLRYQSDDPLVSPSLVRLFRHPLFAYVLLSTPVGKADHILVQTVGLVGHRTVDWRLDPTGVTALLTVPLASAMKAWASQRQVPDRVMKVVARLDRQRGAQWLSDVGQALRQSLQPSLPDMLVMLGECDAVWRHAAAAKGLVLPPNEPLQAALAALDLAP